jgi:DNA-binding CsgD family transcriptional regulator
MTSSSDDHLAHLAELTSVFIEELPCINDYDGLRAAFGDLANAFGYQCFVLGQMPSRGYVQTNINVNNYPVAFVQTAYSEFRFDGDPALGHLIDADAPFLWEDLPAYKSPTPKQAEYLALCRSYGLSRGFSIPMRTAGEPVGVCSLATADNRPVPIDSRPFVLLAAIAAYSRVRAIAVGIAEQKRREIGLTDDEVKYLKLRAQGKSPAAIAAATGASQSDNQELVRSIQSKLQMQPEITLVVRALQLGFFTFNDALNSD